MKNRKRESCTSGSAVANIIMHGGAKDERLEIAVKLERNGGTLVARMEDNGRPFDPTRVPSPALASSLEEAKASDLGIHLMRNFASSMQYERRNGCNQLTLWANHAAGEKHSGQHGKAERAQRRASRSERRPNASLRTVRQANLCLINADIPVAPAPRGIFRKRGARLRESEPFLRQAIDSALLLAAPTGEGKSN